MTQSDIRVRMFQLCEPSESFGWEDVSLTPAESDALVEFMDAGMIEKASKIIDGAYARLFGNDVIH